jgi:hypothetical protein
MTRRVVITGSLSNKKKRTKCDVKKISIDSKIGNNDRRVVMTGE